MADVNKFIDRLLGLPKYCYVKDVEYNHDKKTVNITLAFKKGSRFPCPICKEKCPVHDTVKRSWRHLDIFEYKTTIHAKVPRIECKTHGVKMIDLKWAEPGSYYSLHFETMVLSFSKEMSVAAVAKLVGVHEDSVWRILERYVKKEVSKMDLSGISIIGVDEISIGKGHKYMTIFGNLSGVEPKVVFTVEGKDASTIEAFKQRLVEASVGELSKNMRFSIDMSKAYKAGIKKQFPTAKVVFDRFHVMVNVNKALDNTRREEAWDKKVLLGTRYIWLKNPENLTEAQLDELTSVKDLISRPLGHIISRPLCKGFGSSKS